jgi:vacuolar-type H+-ATPase subunit I/STV1
VLELLLTSLSGEEKRCLQDSTSSSTRWWGIILLRLGVFYMVAMLIAKYDIWPKRLPLQIDMLAFLQPHLWRPFQEILAEAKHLLVWSIFGGVKMAGDGVLVLVERINA